MLTKNLKLLIALLSSIILISGIIYSFTSISYQLAVQRPQHHYHNESNEQFLEVMQKSDFKLFNKESTQINGTYVQTINTNILKGLQNLGNTCYMSSVLQVLFKIMPIELQKLSKYSTVIQLFNQLRQTKDTSVYKQLKKQIQKSLDIVQGHSQQDAHQFYVLFIQNLQAQISSISGELPLSQLLEGRLLNTYVCNRNQIHTKQHAQTFKFLQLTFPPNQGQNSNIQSISVDQLIKYQLKQEQIQGLFCQKCGSNGIFTKKMHYSKLPQILVVHLCRFGPTGMQSYQRIDTPVQYDQILTLYAQQSQNERTPKTYEHTYQLVGIVNHMGSTNWGHYISQVKYSDGNNQEWYQFNDDIVTKISKDKYKNQSRNVYILFYMIKQVKLV